MRGYLGFTFQRTTLGLGRFQVSGLAQVLGGALERARGPLPGAVTQGLSPYCFKVMPQSLFYDCLATDSVVIEQGPESGYIEWELLSLSIAE